jgi:hypothetical protein
MGDGIGSAMGDTDHYRTARSDFRGLVVKVYAGLSGLAWQYFDVCPRKTRAQGFCNRFFCCKSAGKSLVAACGGAAVVLLGPGKHSGRKTAPIVHRGANPTDLDYINACASDQGRLPAK